METTNTAAFDATCPKCRTFGKVCEVTSLPPGPDGFCADSCRNAAADMARDGFVAEACTVGMMIQCDACDGQGFKCCAACAAPVDCEAALRSWSLDWTCSEECAAFMAQQAADSEWGDEVTIILPADDVTEVGPAIEIRYPPVAGRHDNNRKTQELPIVAAGGK